MRHHPSFPTSTAKTKPSFSASCCIEQHSIHCLTQVMAIAPALLLALITLAQWHCAQASSSEDPLSEVASRNNQSLLWGPYRPNLYFGVRPRLPHSLMTGLLWARVEDFQTAQNSIAKASSDSFWFGFFFIQRRRRRYDG
jgi:hypothetical protein